MKVRCLVRPDTPRRRVIRQLIRRLKGTEDHHVRRFALALKGELSALEPVFGKRRGLHGSH